MGLRLWRKLESAHTEEALCAGSGMTNPPVQARTREGTHDGALQLRAGRAICFSLYSYRTLDGDCRSRPGRWIFVGLNPSMQVDHHGVAVAADYVTVHVPRRPSGGVDAVRLVLRVVLGALEAVIPGHPFHRVVLMGAREGEDEHLALEARDDQLRRVIDIDAVGGRNRITAFAAGLNAFGHKDGQRARLD
jgi:hypothetical protein